MNLKCPNCGAINGIPSNAGAVRYSCYNCGVILTPPPTQTNDSSEAVGLIGGAALGAAIGGPVGAIIGAVLGALIGRESKSNV